MSEDGPARLRPGALAGGTVLIAGGAGAVGNAAIQLARWAGATVIATVSSEDKARLAAAAGAEEVVNYKEADVAERIRAAAADGVDLIVEVAAGANAELDLSVLRPRHDLDLRERRWRSVRHRCPAQHGPQRALPVRPALHGRLGPDHQRRGRHQPGD